MLRRVEIVRCAADERPEAWRDALESLTEAALVKTETNAKRVSAVYRARILGSVVALKVEAPLGVRGLICGFGLDRTHARRQWAGAMALLALGIATAEPFVLARARWRDTQTDIERRAELVVVEWLEGPSLLEAMASRSGPERARLARAAGTITATLTRAAVLNRDHKPSNMIVTTPEGNSEPRLSLIDTVGIRTGVLADRSSVRMLRDLVLEPTGVGVPPSARDIAAFLSALRRAGFWGTDAGHARVYRRELVRAVRDAIRAHGDPTPKIDPLAAPSIPRRTDRE